MCPFQPKNLTTINMCLKNNVLTKILETCDAANISKKKKKKNVTLLSNFLFNTNPIYNYKHNDGLC